MALTWRLHSLSCRPWNWATPVGLKSGVMILRWFLHTSLYCRNVKTLPSGVLQKGCIIASYQGQWTLHICNWLKIVSKRMLIVWWTTYYNGSLRIVRWTLVHQVKSNLPRVDDDDRLTKYIDMHEIPCKFEDVRLSREAQKTEMAYRISLPIDRILSKVHQKAADERFQPKEAASGQVEDSSVPGFVHNRVSLPEPRQADTKWCWWVREKGGYWA